MVDTSPLKFEMERHIRTLVAALLDQLCHRATAANQAVISQFQEQKSIVMRASGSTSDCLQLNKDISAAELQLENLKKTLSQSNESLAFLESYRYASAWPWQCYIRTVRS
jgi:hypothetical protein